MKTVHVTAVFKVYESQVENSKKRLIIQQKIFLKKFQTVCKKLLEKASYPESAVRRCSLKKIFLKILLML